MKLHPGKIESSLFRRIPLEGAEDSGPAGMFAILRVNQLHVAETPK